jgi:hypothetical protein
MILNPIENSLKGLNITAWGITPRYYQSSSRWSLNKIKVYLD